VVLAVALGNAFVGLGRDRVKEMDEARYGVSAWEMVTSGDWLVTTYAGEPETWNLKPPLGYQAIAASLAIVATILVATVWMRRWAGRAAAIIGGLLLATAYGLFANHCGRSGELDAPLCLVVVLALAHIGRLDRAPYAVVWCGLLFGLGFLLKSFAIIPPLLVVGGFLCWSDWWRHLRPVPVALGLGAAVVPVAVWAVLRWQADGGPWFLQRMLDEDLLQRAITNIDTGTTHWYGYLAMVGERFAPWSALLVIGALWSWSRIPAPGRWPAAWRLTLLWVVVPLVLFSSSQTHHHWYLAPSYPPLAALVAVGLRRWPVGRFSARVLAPLVLAGVLFAEVRLVRHLVADERRPPEQEALLALAAQYHAVGGRLSLAFAPTHVERFLLTVVDGFTLVTEKTAWRLERTASGYRLVPPTPRWPQPSPNNAARSDGLTPPPGMSAHASGRLARCSCRRSAGDAPLAARCGRARNHA
jgi:4-amino-4-deoxy-L-arabinose transferase-like glycosyltransferase